MVPSTSGMDTAPPPGDDPGGITVLAVDDDAEFVELTAEFLEREDDRFAVVTETSASDGLDRLAAEDVDCVVSDYDMPRMHGIDFLRAVRDDYGDVPFVLFTGKGSEEVASEAISAGVTDYLQKRQGTTQYELLANRVTNAVEQARTRRHADKYHRISTVVREINRVLVQATSREEIDHRVCRTLADAEPYVFAWIGTVDPATDRIEPRAAAGSDAGYLDEITVTVDDSPTGQGPGGTAIRENRVVVSQNIHEDDSFAPWRVAARERGYRAVAAIPLVYDETRYGFLAVYADRTGEFDESERTLLAELGDTIAHAYHRLDIQSQYEDQYRVLFEDAPVMFAFTREVDGEPVIEDCNRVFAETLGYAREELRGTRLGAVYTEESTRALLEAGGYDRALAGEFVREQRELRTRDGDVVETLLRATPRRDTDGEVIGTHALFVDVTDQTRLQTLEALRERMEFALDATNSTLFETDLDSRRETRHGSFERLYGVPSDRVPTREAFYEECVHPADRERLRALQRRDALADTDGTIECDFRTDPDRGDERWIHFEAYVLTGPDGTPQRLVGLNSDITERKERERELERRTEELERENARLDEFTRIVSHDLQNPLNVAETRLELVADECDSDHIGHVADAHERMRTLIDDLLTLARSGREIDERARIELRALADDCWQAVVTGEATLETDLGGEPTLRADRTRVRQLLENLFHNAIEHGGEDVTVTLSGIPDGFAVEDDGPGIPPEAREEVFETGYSTAEEGTGFGLSIVEQVAEAHGWEIRVTEGARGGARFEITSVAFEE